jgi:hypothetical protein
MPLMENVRRISFAQYGGDGLQGGGVRGKKEPEHKQQFL